MESREGVSPAPSPWTPNGSGSADPPPTLRQPIQSSRHFVEKVPASNGLLPGLGWSSPIVNVRARRVEARRGLVISEPSPLPGEETRAQQTAKHHIASAFIRDELTTAGFTIVESREKSAHIPDGQVYYSLVVAQR